MNRMKGIVQNLLLALGSLVLFFSVLEIGTRLFWDVEVQKEHVGIILKGENRELTHEGIQYKTNSLGLRNKEMQREKPEGTKRILVIGDSFIWGDGIPEEELVTVKIENLLNNKNDQIVEVINGGNPSFNTKDEYKQLVRLEPIYSPDLVILYFFTNDLLETTGRDGVKGRNPVNWKQQLKETLRHNSMFMAYLYYHYKNTYASKVGVPQFLLPPDYFNLDDSKPGWVAFKNGLLQIQNYCRQKDIALLFVMIPTLTNLDENYPFAEMHEEVVKFINSNNIHLIDLFEVFAPYQPSDLWVSLDNTHWNGKATTMAANVTVNYLKEYQLLNQEGFVGKLNF